MTIRGNYHLLFFSQLLSGIITYPLGVRFGIWGLVLGFIPFALGMLLVLIKHVPDEREMLLSHKINSYESICAGVIAGVIYFALPQLNWFFALVAGISLARGIIGLVMFTVR